jgi:hypothetical protein
MKLTLTQIMERIFQRFATMPMELLKILFQVSLAYINNVISAYIIWEKLFKACIINHVAKWNTKTFLWSLYIMQTYYWNQWKIKNNSYLVYFLQILECDLLNSLYLFSYWNSQSKTRFLHICAIMWLSIDKCIKYVILSNYNLFYLSNGIIGYI